MSKAEWKSREQSSDQSIMDGQPQQRTVRQMFIEDVNHLPIARRMYHDHSGGFYLYAPTLAACFEAQGVTEKVAQTRAKWMRVAQQYAAAAAAAVEAADEEEAGAVGERTMDGAEYDEEEEDDDELEEKEVEEENEGANEMNEYDGSHMLQYVDCLMKPLLQCAA